MPTIAGLRRRGYTPESIRLLCERAGTSKAGGWTDYASLELALRDDLDPKAPRAMAVLDPVQLELTNWAELFGSDAHREPCHAPVHPQRPELGARELRLGPELWIERDDFAEVPPKGFFRLYPGNRVRLKYGYVIECTGCEKDASRRRHRGARDGRRPTPRAARPAPTRSRSRARSPGSATDDAPAAEVRLYDRLFTEPQPDAGGKDFKASLNPDSLQVVTGFVEPSLADARAERALPVRAPRLLRRRPGRPRAGPAGLQPDRDAARHLDSQVTPAAAASRHDPTLPPSLAPPRPRRRRSPRPARPWPRPRRPRR